MLLLLLELLILWILTLRVYCCTHNNTRTIVSGLGRGAAKKMSDACVLALSDIHGLFGVKSGGGGGGGGSSSKL